MAKPNPQLPSIRFGSFELDLRTGELRKQGIRVKLQEQPLQILVMLLERPGQVVTREELCKKLWSEDTFVDFDHSLNKAINKLREALGDSPDGPVFIETLAKRGYRFIASIEGTRSESPSRQAPIDSIAVFAFEHGSTDPDTESLAVGIPGSIIHSVSHLPGLRVISWRSTSSDEHRQGDPLTIGRKLDVKAVLTGRIWQRANKMRLHVDLLDTANGEEIWGDQYDRDVSELFEVHDEISREVSQKLLLKVTGQDETRRTKRYTENVQAYQLYVRARRWCETRSADGFRRAAEYLNQAIRMDPTYALAHAELAQCISVPCYFGAVDPNVAYPKARTAALRALEIDPNLAEGHEVLATILKNYDWNWAASEKEYKRAIELIPNYAAARYHYSYLLVELGRCDEAIHEATEALSRDPMSGLLNAGLAWVLLNSRRYEWCIDQALTAIEVDSNMVLSYWTLGTAYEQIGKYGDAIEAYEKGISLGATSALAKAFIGHVYARAGEPEKAWCTVQELEQLSKTQFVPWVASAIVYDGLGKKDAAIEALCMACTNRETNLVQMRAHPQLDFVRDDSRFKELERRVGLRPVGEL